VADLGVNVRPGVVVAAGTALAVNVDGAVYASPWWGSYVPVERDNVRVLLCAGEATILGPTITGPRAMTGTVAGTASVGLLPVTIGTDTIQCRYVGTAPSIGSLVLLSWESTTPWVIAAAAAYTPPGTFGGSSAPSAPSATMSGVLHMPAVTTGSYRSADGWGSPGSRGGMSLSAVVQGTAPGSSYAYSGAAFYGAQANQIAGATWDTAQIRLGQRLEVGSNNSALTLHVYVHTSPDKPSGDVSRVAGPYDYTIAAHAGAQEIGPLPSGCYNTLAANGGISITGSPYLGIVGLDVDPASFQLDVGWHRA